MRLKYQSLIALGISSVIFSGCSAGSNGFLNLGIGNALQKSRVCAFKNKLTYETTPIGSTGLALPTFGSAPTNLGQQSFHAAAAPNHGYPVAQAPVVPTPIYSAPVSAAPATSSCGCAANSGSTSSVQVQEYYMPVPPVIQQGTVTNTTPPQSQEVEIVEPPTDVVPQRLNESSDLPAINALPGEFKKESENNFQQLDESLAPLGSATETEDKGFSLETNEQDSSKVADRPTRPTRPTRPRNDDKSILVSAEQKRRAPNADKITRSQRQTAVAKKAAKPKMVTLHARPAESHNLFDRSSHQKKALKTMQANHRNRIRQQNSLRTPQLPAMNTNYRQASNNGAIEFKPLPPVKNEAGPTPKTNMQPLKESGKTRMADNVDNHTAAAKRRVPLLRATTASSASILSLKNLANVISDEDQTQTSSDRRTADESGRTADAGGTRLK